MQQPSPTFFNLLELPLESGADPIAGQARSHVVDPTGVTSRVKSVASSASKIMLITYFFRSVL